MHALRINKQLCLHKLGYVWKSCSKEVNWKQQAQEMSEEKLRNTNTKSENPMI
jgi:hypothetical protein